MRENGVLYVHVCVASVGVCVSMHVRQTYVWCMLQGHIKGQEDLAAIFSFFLSHPCTHSCHGRDSYAKM